MKNRRNMISFVIVTALAFAGMLTLCQENARAQLDNNCIISINKVATPANDKVFDFTVTGAQDTTFSLSDPSHPLQVLGINVSQTLTVTEEDIQGWALDGIECTQGIINCGTGGEFVPCLTAVVDGNSVTFECLDNDTASCTFTNSLLERNIPTLSEWGLIAMAGVLGIAGLLVIRRRKATA
jgi:IPTL-CTERM motif